MTRVTVRLARLEAVVPKPVPAPEVDLSWLTPAQKEWMAEIQPRFLALGLSGLTDDEVDDLAEVAEILKAPDPPGEVRA